MYIRWYKKVKIAPAVRLFFKYPKMMGINQYHIHFKQNTYLYYTYNVNQFIYTGVWHL